MSARDHCAYTVIDKDGNEEPCGRDVAGHRWYQNVGEHEDMLDTACEYHENQGGNLMAALTAERDRSRAIAVDLEQENAMLRDLWARSEVNLTRTVVGK